MRRTWIAPVFFLAVFAIALIADQFVFVPSLHQNPPPLRHPIALSVGQVEVLRVIDGDTIIVRTASEEIQTVRLIGINTPETVDPRKPVQCFGKQASARTKSLLEGKAVILTADSTQANVDKYGRSLRYVSLEDGKDINLALIRDGFAYEYTYKLPYEKQAAYRAAERDARKAQAGLWAPETCHGSLTAE